MKQFYKVSYWKRDKWLRAFVSLLLFMAVAIEGFAANVISINSPSGESQGYSTWEAAMEGLNQQPDPASGQFYTIFLLQDVDMSVLPAKACKITSNHAGIHTLRFQNVGINLLTPVIFDKVNLAGSKSKPNGWYRLYANGHRLEFTKNVQMSSEHVLILFGGVSDGSIASTDLILNGGTFKNVHGGNEDGVVTGTTSVTIGGNVKIQGSLYGGNFSGTVEGSTCIRIVENAYLQVGTSVIDSYLCGGCYSGNVYGNTSVLLESNAIVTVGNKSITGYVVGGCIDGNVNSKVSGQRSVSKIEMKDNASLTIKRKGCFAVAGGYGATSHCDSAVVLLSDQVSFSATGSGGFIGAGSALGHVDGALMRITGGKSLAGKFGGGGVYGSVDNAWLEISGTPTFSNESGTGSVSLLGAGLACLVKEDTHVTLEANTGAYYLSGGNYASASQGDARVLGTAILL